MKTREAPVSASNAPLVRIRRIAADRAGNLFDNPTSKRDFRVQMRGWRIPILLAIYLAILTFVTILAYSDIARADVDLQGAQSRLTNFYFTISTTVAAVIALVVPAMASTAVVLERSRGSLDLLFSAPVKPESFLLGKLLAIVRFVAMMLALSLPASSAALMLGGASLFDVLAAALLVLMSGTVLGALGLVVSSRAKDPVRALLGGYGLAAVWLAATGSLVYTVRWDGLAIVDTVVPFFVQLSPFAAALTSGTVSGPFGLGIVPNILLTAAFTLWFVRYLLRGAAISIAPAGHGNVSAFRLQTLVFAAIVGAIPAWAFLKDIPLGEMSLFVGPAATGLTFAALIPVNLFLSSWLAGFGTDGTRRERPDGPLSLRKTLTGRPSGAWPFLAAMTVVPVVSACAVWMLGSAHYGRTLVEGSLVGGAASLAAFSLFWSIGRFVSARTLSIGTGRIAALCSAVVLGVLPPLVVSAFTGWGADSPWYALTLAAPLLTTMSPDYGLAMLLYTGIVGFVAFLIAMIAEWTLADNLARLERKRAVREKREAEEADRRAAER